MATATKTPSLSVSLEPSPQAAEGVSLLQQAQGITIIDRASHEVCRTFLKGAKLLKRTIEAHYDAIKKPINEAKGKILDMEKMHLAPVDAAIKLAESQDTAWVRETEKREREEADQRRRQAEAAEELRRAVEAEQAEAEALKLEASRTVLSERERLVVNTLAIRPEQPPPLKAWESAVRIAGYKDVAGTVNRFLESEKILTALANADKAAEIRRQSEAAKAAPILVETAPVESEIAKVSGTSVRTYFACDSQVDLRKLAQAVLDGKVSLEAIQPNMVHLNAQARSLKAMFPQVYPGCALSKRDGVTG